MGVAHHRSTGSGIMGSARRVRPTAPAQPTGRGCAPGGVPAPTPPCPAAPDPVLGVRLPVPGGRCARAFGGRGPSGAGGRWHEVIRTADHTGGAAESAWKPGAWDTRREQAMAAGTTQPGVDPAGVPGRGEEEVHLSLWRVIRRRRWRIVAGVVVGLALGLLYGVLTG